MPRKAKPRRPPTDKTSRYSLEFEQFWSAYPRKENKWYAWQCWQRVRQDGHKHGLILLRAEQFAESDIGRGACMFIPHPSTWLNQRRFLDDPARWSFAKVDGNGHVDWNFKA
jgi:hypothetical protein